MADAETNALLVAHGITQIMAEAHMRAATLRKMSAEIHWSKDGIAVASSPLIKGGINLMAGALNFVSEDYYEPAPSLSWMLDPEPSPDSAATRALANALDRTIAAGTWNGTSFGRK